MPVQFKTPGVYIVEKNTFPNSVVEVSTGVAAFIGYTEKADNKGETLTGKPWRISSLAEYEQYFGGGYQNQVLVNKATGAEKPGDESLVTVNGQQYYLADNASTTLYLYNSIRLFYGNGGGACYIVSVADYKTFDKKGFDLNLFTGDEVGIDLLQKEVEPALLVIPDAVLMGSACYGTIYTKMLSHCGYEMNRFAVLDTIKPVAGETPEKTVADFRMGIGINSLYYAAAYYPWIATTVIQDTEVSNANIHPESDVLTSITIEVLQASTDYSQLLKKIKNKLNELPPSGAIAGIYAFVDNSRGVWKAPANVSVNMVSKPMVEITDEQQENFNVDSSGKSINVIRPFRGEGTVVWGARTLDGNSEDWRYVNVRRTVIMLEESVKLAAKAFVFEPNTADTWLTVKSMIQNFLTSVWKRGGLAGAMPEDAFSVNVGLGDTMTANDILDGTMRITVLVAISHPAEFIEITFQQQMQKS